MSDTARSAGFWKRNQLKIAPWAFLAPGAIMFLLGIARLGSIDGRRAQVLFWLFQTRRLDLHRYRASDNPRTWPHRSSPIGRTSQAEAVQRVRDGAGIEFGKAS